MRNSGPTVATNRTQRHVARIALAGLALAGALALPRQAGAQSALGGDVDPPGLDCVGGTTGTLSSTAQELVAGQEATLSWNTQVPAGCPALKVTIDGVLVNRTGSMAVAGIDSSSIICVPDDSACGLGFLRTYYTLYAVFGSARRPLATRSIVVRLPVDSTGRPVVTIGANHHAPLFVLAVRTPWARVTVRPDVELDLTDLARPSIFIAPGVQISGGRTATIPGGRLYVRCGEIALNGVFPYCGAPPNSFLVPTGDGVRISGLRIEGADQEIANAGAPVSHGIVIYSYNNTEIDHNEISGWRGSGVLVTDVAGRLCLTPDATCPVANPRSVRIHDNYIHHNQTHSRDGYGVSVTHGAYALIERNVFDYNRHAIMGGGEPGTGYLAYRNLVLENGGEHTTIAGKTIYTHQFDMHGTENCYLIGSDHNCGLGGEFMDIGWNSFFYTNDNAFKLRGEHSSIGAHVVSNVFAHVFLTNDAVLDPALGGNLGDMTIADDNLVGINEKGNYGHCDFDGDGNDDYFLATGQTWWFRSPGRQWNYLNTSRARLSELTLDDVTHDGVCDVIVDGVVVSGGRGWARPQTANLVWKATTGNLTLWEMDGGTVAGQTAPGTIPASWHLAGLGNLSGAGSTDLVWGDDAGQTWLWNMADGWRVGERAVRGFGTLQGVGDFDGDGVDDMLWRDAAGQLAIGFTRALDAGDAGDGEAIVPIGSRNVPGPVDPAWVVRGVGDFDGDGRADILFDDARGSIAIAYMAGTQWVGDRVARALPRSEIQAVADFDNDGRADVLWRDGSRLTIWFGGEAERATTLTTYTGMVPGDASWTIVDARDFNRDGRADLLWQDAATGRLVVWILDGGRFEREEYPRLPAPRNATVVSGAGSLQGYRR